MGLENFVVCWDCSDMIWFDRSNYNFKKQRKI